MERIAKMNLWLAIAIFFMSIGDDCLGVWYMRRVVAGKRKSAALLSGGLTALIALEVFIYVSDWIYIIPNCIGSVIGTWLAIWIEDRLPRVTPRTKQGRFKRVSGV